MNDPLDYYFDNHAFFGGWCDAKKTKGAYKNDVHPEGFYHLPIPYIKYIWPVIGKYKIIQMRILFTVERSFLLDTNKWKYGP